MQLKVKVTSKGQGHVYFTTEQETFLHCTMNVWAYFTAYDTRHIISYPGKGYKSILN